jgi:predicted nucleotidyltransferase
MTADPIFDAVAIFRVLNRHAVDYVVVGGFAVAAHGVIRATEDLDLVVDQSWHNAERLGTALTELDAESATGAGTPLTAEALVRREDRLFDTKHGQLHILNQVGTVPAYGDLMPAQLIEVDGERVNVATVEQLRAMKTKTGRAKDQVDLAELDETS